MPAELSEKKNGTAEDQPLHGVRDRQNETDVCNETDMEGVMVGILPLHQKEGEGEKKTPAAVLTVKAGHSW